MFEDRCPCLGYRPQDPGAATDCVRCGHGTFVHGMYGCFAFVAPPAPPVQPSEGGQP